MIGTAHLATGQKINGHFGTTTRKDGKIQVTYDGHPLYTYAGDTQPGQTSGNGINQEGGIWNVITTAASGGAGASAGLLRPRPHRPAAAAAVAFTAT